MRNLVSIGLLAAGLCFGPVAPASAASVAASPAGPSMTVAPAVVLVADGCGPGARRGAGGRCGARFNLFRHHRAFHRSNRRLCTRVETPNGSVRRCRI